MSNSFAGRSTNNRTISYLVQGSAALVIVSVLGACGTSNSLAKDAAPIRSTATSVANAVLASTTVASAASTTTLPGAGCAVVAAPGANVSACPDGVTVSSGDGQNGATISVDANGANVQVSASGTTVAAASATTVAATQAPTTSTAKAVATNPAPNCLPAGFPVPAGATIVVCDNTGSVSAVMTTPSTADAYAFFLKALPAAGYTVTTEGIVTSPEFVANLIISGNGFTSESTIALASSNISIDLVK